MKVRGIFSKCEFAVLCLLLLSFLFVYADDMRQKPISSANEYFLDLNLVNTTYDGTEPIVLPSGAGPWSFYQVTSNNVLDNLVDGDILYVFGHQNSASSFTLPSALTPPDNNITYIGAASAADTSYFYDAYTTAVYNYPKFNAPASDYAVELNGRQEINIQNFIFNGSSNYTAFKIHWSQYNYVNNCEIYSSGTGTALSITGSSTNLVIDSCSINSDTGIALFAEDSDTLTIEKNEIVRTSGSATGSVIEFDTCSCIEMNENTTAGSQECDSILKFTETADGYFCRNLIHLDTSEECTYGIEIGTSECLHFENNSVYASCSDSAVYDYCNYSGFEWYMNTINNIYTSATATDKGYGYYGERSVSITYCLAAFVNNVIYASSSANKGYAIYIGGLVSFWQPSAGAFEYNCYFGEYGANDYFGYLASVGGGTSYYSANFNGGTTGHWTYDTNDNTNSMNADPVFLGDGYHINASTSPAKDTGRDLTGISVCLMDIDNGEIPPSADISMGCDQIFFIKYVAIDNSCVVNYPDVTVGSAVNPVDSSPTAYMFGVGLHHYGVPTLTISAITPSNGNFSFIGRACGLPLPVTLNYGDSDEYDFTYNVAGNYTSTVTITHGLGTDQLDFEGWGN